MLDVPIIRPYTSEFIHFDKLLSQIHQVSHHTGVCKLIPPPTWRATPLHEYLRNVRLSHYESFLIILTFSKVDFKTYRQNIPSFNKLTNSHFQFQRAVQKFHSHYYTETKLPKINNKEVNMLLIDQHVSQYMNQGSTCGVWIMIQLITSYLDT
jgi:hypothetical protein